MTAALMLGSLQDLGVGWVILGHSERRALMKESSELIADKTGEPGHYNTKFSTRSVSMHAVTAVRFKKTEHCGGISTAMWSLHRRLQISLMPAFNACSGLAASVHPREHHLGSLPPAVQECNVQCMLLFSCSCADHNELLVASCMCSPAHPASSHQ